VKGNPELERVWARETAPEQALLDVHLGGAGVDGHATNAEQLASFTRKMSEAVKFTARDALRKSRYSSNLLVEGAQPGSVRLVFRVPDQEVKDEEPRLAHTEASKEDSNALRRISALLSAASATDGEPDDSLAAYLVDLPAQAKGSLKTLVNTVKSANWSISGSLRQRHHDPEEVRLSQEGASRLAEAISANPPSSKPDTLHGVIAGYNRGLGTAFITQQGKQVTLVVPEVETLNAVAELGVDPDQKIVAGITIFETLYPGGGTVRTSRRPDWIRADDEQGVQLDTVTFQESPEN
jgi:hypothetical protein